MREEWDTKQLKDFCTDFKSAIVDGPFGSNLKREHFVDQGIPVLKLQNIKSHKIVLKNLDYISSKKAKELKRHSYQQNDIVMTKLGNPLGVSAIVEDIDDGVIVADLVRIRADKIDTKYLCYQLNSPVVSSFINSKQKGATRPRVKISIVRELPIAAPPLPEQKRIVAILDEAFEGIDRAVANAEKNLANARELFESYLNNVFTQKGDGWVETTLGKAYDVRDGTHDSPKYQQKGRALITSKNLKRDGLTFSKVKYISEGDYNNIARRSAVHKGDVLFAMIGTIGNPIVVEVEPDFAIKNVGLFKLGETRSGQFLKYYLKTRFVIRKMKSEAKGTTQKFVGLGYLREFPVFNPPSLTAELDIVDQLSAYEKETQRLEAIYQRKLTALDQLKQSLLQKAFSGELTADVSTKKEAVA